MFSPRTLLGNLAGRACEKLVARTGWIPRIIGRRTAKNYLLRYYPIGRRSVPDQAAPKKPRPWNLFLHNFQRSDHDYELHSHPHQWAFYLVLSGGYREERTHDPLRVQNQLHLKPILRTVTRRPFSFNFLEAKDFHRIDLLDPDRGAWTIGLIGPEVRTWGFWDRATGEFREAED